MKSKEARIMCEMELLSLAQKMVEAYKKYNPDGDYLSMFYIDDCIGVMNRSDEEPRIDVWKGAKLLRLGGEHIFYGSDKE